MKEGHGCITACLVAAKKNFNNTMEASKKGMDAPKAFAY
jgi:hypothetical protein